MTNGDLIHLITVVLLRCMRINSANQSGEYDFVISGYFVISDFVILYKLVLLVAVDMLQTVRLCVLVPLRQAGSRNFSRRAEEFKLANKARILEDTVLKTPRHFDTAGTINLY